MRNIYSDAFCYCASKCITAKHGPPRDGVIEATTLTPHAPIPRSPRGQIRCLRLPPLRETLPKP